MKLAGYSSCLLVIATIVVSVHTDTVTYDMTDKNQFTFYFRDQWKTMFNTPQPIANPAKENIVALIAEELYFQPCFTVARRSGKRYFTDRLWGMMHALKHCDITSSTVLPVDSADNRPEAVLEMEFIQNATYNSYNRKLHHISMEMKAKKTEVNQPYHIYKIIETCSNKG